MTKIKVSKVADSAGIEDWYIIQDEVTKAAVYVMRYTSEREKVSHHRMINPKRLYVDVLPASQRDDILAAKSLNEVLSRAIEIYEQLVSGEVPKVDDEE